MLSNPVPHAIWTQHARVRLQQRGITQVSAELLLDWGYYEPISGSKCRVFFRKRDLHRLQATLPKPQWLALENRKQLFAVVSGDDEVITIGHRRQHLVRQ
jgi:hypothetical protein